MTNPVALSPRTAGKVVEKLAELPPPVARARGRTPPTRPNQWVKVTGAAVSAGLYPAVVTEYDADAAAWADFTDAVRVASPLPLVTGNRYPALRSGTHSDGYDRFASNPWPTVAMVKVTAKTGSGPRRYTCRAVTWNGSAYAEVSPAVEFTNCLEANDREARIAGDSSRQQNAAVPLHQLPDGTYVFGIAQEADKVGSTYYPGVVHADDAAQRFKGPKLWADSMLVDFSGAHSGATGTGLRGWYLVATDGTVIYRCESTGSDVSVSVTGGITCTSSLVAGNGLFSTTEAGDQTGSAYAPNSGEVYVGSRAGRSFTDATKWNPLAGVAIGSGGGTARLYSNGGTGLMTPGSVTANGFNYKSSDAFGTTLHGGITADLASDAKLVVKGGIIVGTW